MNKKSINLNDFTYFSTVVRCGGFSLAAKELSISRSVMSTRIKSLEEQLGVRLIQRTTRRFAITEAGERILKYCLDMERVAKQAQEEADQLSTDMGGAINISCPVLMSQVIMPPLIAEFMKANTTINVRLISTDRIVDVISEGLDCAIRVRTQDGIDTDAELVIRRFGVIRRFLVASPGYLARNGRPISIECLEQHDSLGSDESTHSHVWKLKNSSSEKEVQIRHTPNFVSGNLSVLMSVAEKGLGIALLPESIAREAIRKGTLEEVLPQWSGEEGIVYAIFPSRQGIRPAVRKWIDFLVKNLASSLT